MPPKTPQGSEGPQEKPVHANENTGLVDKLRSMLSGKTDTVETPISEGADVLDNSAEHQEMVSQLADQRAQRDIVETEEAQLRAQALQELGGASGVVSAGPEEIERKIAEIRARNTPEADMDIPAS
ncbi:hypothetical protein IPM44_02955 [bacterium]|nr:MAG: hypothetical protein IPM44_02955 [bacterium]